MIPVPAPRSTIGIRTQSFSDDEKHLSAAWQEVVTNVLLAVDKAGRRRKECYNMLLPHLRTSVMDPLDPRQTEE